MHGKLLHHIQQLVEDRENPSEPIRILDLACGVRGVGADQLQSLFPDSIEVHGIDFFLAKPEARLSDFGAQAKIIQGNAIEGLPYPDAHFDFVYSWQFLPHVCAGSWIEEYPEKFEDYMNCVLQVGDILKPNKEAWLDDDILARSPYLPFNHPIAQRLLEKGIITSQGMKERNLNGTMHTQGGFGNPYLVLQKSIFI